MSDSSETDSNCDLNVYTFEDYLRLVTPLHTGQTISGLDKQNCLRTLLDFSLSHSLLFKSRQRREATLKDISITTLENKIEALVIKSVLPYHKYQFYGCIRHKMVEACPIYALAAYMFGRFHLTDEYTAVELNKKILADPMFHSIKILKGNYRFQNISYSQQHESASVVINAAGFDPKATDASKLTGSSHLCKLNCKNDRPMLINSNNLPLETLLKVAGFPTIEEYVIERSTIEPPVALLKMIFPFVDEEMLQGENVTSIRFRAVLRSLRRILIQDMTVIKLKYPKNVLLQHEIFQSPEFEEYYRQMVDKNIVVPCPQIIDPFLSRESSMASLPTCSSFEDDDKFSHISFKSDLLSEDLCSILAQHQHQINQLQKQIYLQSSQQMAINKDLLAFIKQQNEVFQNQSAYLLKIHNTMNGLMIVMASRSNSSLYHVQRSIMENSEMMTAANNKCIQQGLNNTFELLTKLNTHTNNFLTITTHNYNTAPPPQEDERQSKRRKALRRRLSRQALTLYEMWDDFKSLEAELKANEISTTEWLKVHGSSERQFRYTRLKIIRFVESEAERRHVPVEVIKEKLHNKMRDRLRPWTLDEVQRMLTAGKRIQLD